MPRPSPSRTAWKSSSTHRRQPRLLFTTLFDNAPLTPGLLAATFLAVLELTRLGAWSSARMARSRILK
jgi:hypothetical protein